MIIDGTNGEVVIESKNIVRVPNALYLYDYSPFEAVTISAPNDNILIKNGSRITNSYVETPQSYQSGIDVIIDHSMVYNSGLFSIATIRDSYFHGLYLSWPTGSYSGQDCTDLRCPWASSSCYLSQCTAWGGM